MSNDAKVTANALTRAWEPPVAHPLALELADAYRAAPAARVLLLGIGTGRNIPVLLAAGVHVSAVESEPERIAAFAVHNKDAKLSVTLGRYAGPYPFAGIDAALSTHALLHGTHGDISAAVSAVRKVLGSGGRFFATLGSTSDPRCGTGRRIAENTYAALGGSEAGVAHTYYDEAAARTLFSGFKVESLVQTSAGDAGRWAHSADEARSLVHWFVRARMT